MRRSQETLDARAWLVWGGIASLPALIGRNPFVLAAVLLAVLGVRTAWLSVASGAAWGWLLRLAALFATIGVLFNVLVVHAGDHVFARLPEVIPVLGGPLTLNALVYGILSAVALLTLVLIGVTLGATLDVPALLRLLPERLTPVAVAGSVAWLFVPQTAVAFREIREAQAARGHRIGSARDLIPLVVPLLTGALERSVTLAEALESRAFGAGLAAPAPRLRGLVAALGLAGSLCGAYLLATGRPFVALAALSMSMVALVIAVREPRQGPRTRYRPLRWTWRDGVVAGASAVTGAVVLVTVAVDPAALQYEPYPSLTAPRVSLPLLAAIALLLTPAFVAPTADLHPPGEEDR